MGEKIRTYLPNCQTAKLQRVARWAVMIGAYAYLIYRLCTYEGYAELGAYFSNLGVQGWLLWLFVLILMPANLLTEAWRWQTLQSGWQQVSLSESLRQVCYGMLTGFITPYQLGDVPGRVMASPSPSLPKGRGDGTRDKAEVAKAIGHGYIGSVMMTVVCVTGGVGGVLLGTIGMLISRYRLYGQVLWQTTLRYAIWLIQCYLAMYAVGIEMPIGAGLLSIIIYYALITISPTMPAADAAVRGSWALVVFVSYTDNVAAITLASVGVWAINTIFPMLYNIFLRKNLQD